MYVSKTSAKLIHAHDTGYRVTPAGIVIKPDGDLCYVYDRTKGGMVYTHFNVRVDGKSTNAPVHRLQAYQKFGTSMFDRRLVVRHMDGNSLNNSYSNLELGTHRDNALDRKQEDRIRGAKLAAATQRKLTADQRSSLLCDRETGMTYKELMAKYGLAKSTVSYIVRGITYQ